MADSNKKMDEDKQYLYEKSDRLPTLKDLKVENNFNNIKNTTTDTNKSKHINNMNYNNFGYRDEIKTNKRDSNLYQVCFVSVVISFLLGLVIGVIIVSQSRHTSTVNTRNPIRNTGDIELSRTMNSYKADREVNNLNEEETEKEMILGRRFSKVSFTGDNVKLKENSNRDIYPKGLTEDMKDILKDTKRNNHRHTINIINVNSNDTSDFVPDNNTVLYNNIIWGPKVEDSMPQGYGQDISEIWERYVNQSEVVKMEVGCGRMQNRLVTFRDGIQACVRYRQNTDQIQGEIFSFYVGKLLNLTNLAPAVVKVVDVKNKLWSSVATDISSAQWNSNRAVVFSKYIPSLESANIPDIFKPTNRHLNKYDILKMSLQENDTNSNEILINKLKSKKNNKIQIEKEIFDHINMDISKKTVNEFIELAQWSDLIIFDYLTANLDRIVNNLFNYQWNINIMDGPAHNLARKMDSGLLVFLDNESGLLHGYRLLKKYNVYHSLMLDNLCVFRKRTVDALRMLYESKSVGAKLSEIFHRKNDAIIRDILPTLPEKNSKILHDRIGKVLGQIEKCEQSFSNR